MKPRLFSKNSWGGTRTDLCCSMGYIAEAKSLPKLYLAKWLVPGALNNSFAVVKPINRLLSMFEKGMQVTKLLAYGSELRETVL